METIKERKQSRPEKMRGSNITNLPEIRPTFKVKEEKRNGKKPEERGDNKTHRRRKE